MRLNEKKITDRFRPRATLRSTMDVLHPILSLRTRRRQTELKER